jgi:hypothetical protein
MVMMEGLFPEVDSIDVRHPSGSLDPMVTDMMQFRQPECQIFVSQKGRLPLKLIYFGLPPRKTAIWPAVFSRSKTPIRPREERLLAAWRNATVAVIARHRYPRND